MKHSITQEELKSQIEYDPETGIITKDGKVCGSKKSTRPYSTVWLVNSEGQRFRVDAHRVAFLYVHGYVPEFIDHEDNDGYNNKISNLRESSQLENNRNRSKAINNTSGYKGVSWFASRNKWNVRFSSRITGKPVYKNLGYFDNILDAARIYNKACLEEYGEFAKLNLDENNNPIL